MSKVFGALMIKIYGTNAFVMDSGERYCHVVDRASGLPEYYPNLFLTTQIRNKGDAFSTMEAAAGHLVVLFRFLDRRDINLERRFLAKNFLFEHELDDLRDFTQRRFRKPPASACNVSMSFTDDELEESKGAVNNGTQYARLTTVALYLSWFAKHLLKNPSQEDYDRINAMAEQIKERRPAKKGRNETRDRALDKDQIDALFEVIRLGSECNPFSPPVQRRNRLMILLLYHLGIRGGELLNIRIPDIDFSANRITIVRRADEKDDSRVREPNAKTLERIIPLGDTLVKELHEYITRERRRVTNAKKNNFLFVTHKDGPTVGQPVSKAAYYKVLRVVAAVSPQLYTVTGHMLRHTWNDKFSEKMDGMDTPLSEARQEQVRSFLMGWKPGSGTAATYNKRFIEKKAHEANLSMQEASGTRAPKELKNDE